ncbi:SCP2 sterol-binding domain-containing protein [Deinococcus sp.]|uniref:SCP2 sterol-binding domain-containing protein n=1 Tax=Deinococcus sp. TaxID=47478 RepID=UPI0025CC5865|nr:SCP2 sterol-binding domain-containing protein [Deinococcus sp.]
MSPSSVPSAERLKVVLTALYTSAGDVAGAEVLGQRQLVLSFVFTNPDLTLCIDGRSAPVVVSSEGPFPSADLTFRLAGANIDKFWRGELNAMAGVVSGDLKIEGSLITALSLAPALGGLQARYRELMDRELLDRELLGGQ